VELWRSQVLARAQRAVPSALRSDVADGIRAKYSARRTLLEAELGAARRAESRARSSLKTTIDKQRQELNQIENAARAQLLVGEEGVEQKFAGPKAALQAELSAAATRSNEELRDLNAELTSLQKVQFGAEWKRERAEHEMRRLANARFGPYCRRILGLRS
jgi:hypothetical protein